MAIELTVPKLGLTMEEAVLVSWSVEPGAKVAEEDIVLVLETDKVTYEMPAPGAGLLHPLVEPGSKILVSQVIGYLAADEAELEKLKSEAPAAGGGDAAAAPAEEKKEEPKAAAAPAAAAAAPADGRIKASPLAKAMAKEHNLDLSLIAGTGPGGRIVKADILTALEKGVSAPASAEAAAPAVLPDDEMALTCKEEIPISGVRKVIFNNMHASLQEQAQLTLHTELSATGLIELRKFFNERYAKEGIKVSYNAIIIKAVAQALKAHPIVNASVVGDVIKQWAQVHVGVAMDLGDGLVVPKVRRADIKGVKAISLAFDEMVEKAKSGGLMPDDLQGGTFTITNLGAWDIDHFTPIVNPPESAILGLGRITEKAVVKDGEVVAEPRLGLSLTIDHRVIDGAPGAAFLKTLKEFLQNPLLMLE
jgi:pyruvate dehydrogenase complex dihydrolipoamide acetyltransferase long form